MTVAAETDVLNSSRRSFLKKGQYVDASFESHEVMDFLRSNKVAHRGGNDIGFDVVVDEPGTLQHYEGRDIPAPIVAEILQEANLPWRKGIYEIDLARDARIENAADGQIIDIAETRMKAGQEGFVRELNRDFYTSDGTGTSLHGLPAIEAVGTYAGINPVTYPVWDVVRESQGAEPLDLDLVDEVLNRLMLRGAQIAMISCHIDNLAVFQRAEKALQTIEVTSLTGKPLKMVGRAPMTYYSNIRVVADTNVTTSRVHFHDFREFAWVPSSDETSRLEMSEWVYQKTALRKDEYRSDIMPTHNFICRNRHQQGVITDIVPA